MAGFDDLSLDLLQTRRSAKWVRYPPDVLPMWIAEMDFPLAPPIRDVLLAAVERSDCGYAAPGELSVAFSEFAAARLDWAVSPDRIVIVPDVMVGAAEVLRLTTAPGDGVVINPPVYPPFFATIPAVERRIVEVPLLESDHGWELDLDALEDAFASAARAYLLCNPHNPTGQVFSRGELEQVAELANRYGVIVIADEIHSALVLRGAFHTPYLSLGEEAAGRSVTLTGASKAWNTPGLKCGLVVAGSSAMRDEIGRNSKLLLDETGLFGILASTAAFRDGGPWLDSVLEYLDGNRRYLAELLETSLPAVRYRQPQASYLAWLDCRALPFGERGRVAFTRGLDFGRQGAGFVRLNFATSRALLEEAVERMAAALSAAGSV